LIVVFQIPREGVRTLDIPDTGQGVADSRTDLRAMSDPFNLGSQRCLMDIRHCVPSRLHAEQTFARIQASDALRLRRVADAESLSGPLVHVLREATVKKVQAAVDP
ncbi:MAG: hypothetical protein ACSLFF_03465, partial [Solirubrobacterales bacterium]